MTPEEIEALKKRAEEAEAAAEAAKTEAVLQKKAAEDAESVNKTLQEQLAKAGVETKSDLPKVKVSDKTYIFVYPAFKHDNKDYTAKEAAKSKDAEFLKELIDAQVIILSK
jgi:hypothetical protein